MSTPDLHVVCGSCGSEVSPYVTECPYCGNRIRKRAPKLERRGDELTPREPRRRRLRKPRAPQVELGTRPWATLAAVIVPAVLILVQRSTLASFHELGGIVGSVDEEWWRYLASPFVYPDIPYWFVTSLGILIFGSAVERRLGTVATAVLMIACGALGMLAADGVEQAIDGKGVLLLGGANGIALGLLAAWAVLKWRELRADPDEEGVDLVGVAVCAVVLIMLPLVEDFANVFAGLAGALVGAACGLAAAGARGRQRNPGL